MHHCMDRKIRLHEMSLCLIFANSQGKAQLLRPGSMIRAVIAKGGDPNQRGDAVYSLMQSSEWCRWHVYFFCVVSVHAPLRVRR